MNSNAQQMYGKHSADVNTQVRLGVGVIARDDQGRILLEKRSDCGMWGVLGGCVEPGESIFQAAVREVKEESGLDIVVTNLIGVYSEPTQRIVTYIDNGDVRHLIDIIVDARIVGGRLTISAESEQLQFFDLAVLPAEIVPPARAVLQDVVKGVIGIIR